MKTMKKLMALVLVAMMAMALAVTASAAGTGTITITPPEGLASDATNKYKIYKVFDADGNGTAISYKLVDGKTTAPAGFSVDNAGNVTYSGTGTDELTAEDIAAIATYVEGDAPVKEVIATGSNSVTATDLPNGFYYITTSTGTVVTIDSTNPNATVQDKNSVPQLNKKITGASSFDEDGKKALAQVGTDVTYTATITVGKGMENYAFHDHMDSSLSLKADSINVTGAGEKGTGWVIKATPDTGDTLTITFADGLAEGTEIVITYSATVTSDALTVDPAKNTAYVSYGDENDSSNNKTPPSETETYNAKFTVTKKDGEGKALAGAGFVIKNANNKYYKIANNVVSWEDDIANATEYTSNAQGAVPSFTGLANGTYTLVEKTVPNGYNKAADQTFTVAEHDYTAANLEQAAEVVNNAGTELPSTGGIGTKIFYTMGAVLVIGAGVVLVSRKRAGE